jgi:hypothetical protein
MSSKANDTASQLVADNYTEWKQEMLSILQSKGLGKYVTTRAADLLKDKDLTLTLKMQIQDGEEMALGRIRRSVSSSYKEMLMECTTALEAWKLLENHFEGKETYNKIHLLTRLIDESLPEEGDMVENIEKFLSTKSQLVRRLKGCDVEISKDLLVTLILARLPRSFEIVARILENTENLSLEKVQAELVREASRRMVKRPRALESANFASDGAAPRKKPKLDTSRLTCSFCAGKGHVSDKCWLNPEGSNFRKELHDKLSFSIRQVNN